MREVLVQITCDKCGESHLEDAYAVESVEFSTTDGRFEIDLCLDCLPLWSAGARAKGRAKGKGKTEPLNHVCEFCDRAFATSRGLNSHISRMH